MSLPKQEAMPLQRWRRGRHQHPAQDGPVRDSGSCAAILAQATAHATGVPARLQWALLRMRQPSQLGIALAAAPVNYHADRETHMPVITTRFLGSVSRLAAARTATVRGLAACSDRGRCACWMLASSTSERRGLER